MELQLKFNLNKSNTDISCKKAKSLLWRLLGLEDLATAPLISLISLTRNLFLRTTRNQPEIFRLICQIYHPTKEFKSSSLKTTISMMHQQPNLQLS